MESSIEQHWTEANSEAFAHRMAFDFIAQIEKKMGSLPISQIELARRLKVSEGAVSKLLNNPQNLTLRTIAKYSRALGIKAAIVAYDDGDPQNTKGPITSEIFTTCWEQAGRPRDVWALDAMRMHQSVTTGVICIGDIPFGPTGGNNSQYPYCRSFVDIAVSGSNSSAPVPFSLSTIYYQRQPEDK
ncbi:hypothetical protein SBA4_4930003 [Candidatus Sulfopaludibacter sp. SbA4]|nr:hypothetical protein SBA4_4930003 [Candidatus Sulfopaludibacter sp. SbA4]